MLHHEKTFHRKILSDKMENVKILYVSFIYIISILSRKHHLFVHLYICLEKSQLYNYEHGNQNFTYSTTPTIRVERKIHVSVIED